MNRTPRHPGRRILGALVGSSVLALGLGGALGCSRLTLPTGEELAAVNAAYDDPRGQVDGELMAEIAPSALSRLDTILSLGRLEFVVDSLTEVSEVVQDVAADEGGSRFKLTAIATVDKICPGEGGAPDAEQNGHIAYTMRVQKNGVLDTVWGDFEACRFLDPGETFPGYSGLPREPGALVTYDGSLDVYLGGNLQLAELDFQHFLFRVEGDLTLPELEAEIAFDFRMNRERQVEIRLPADGGDVVLTFVPGSTVVSLESGEGSFCCDFDDRFCVAAEANDCGELVAGDRVFEW